MVINVLRSAEIFKTEPNFTESDKELWIFTKKIKSEKCFVHPIFRCWFLVTFGDEVTKILHNLCLHFARQDGQDGKKMERKSKVTKIPKTKRRKYGMNETFN